MSSAPDYLDAVGVEVQQWLIFASNEQADLEVLLGLAETELHYDRKLLDFLLKQTAKLPIARHSTAAASLFQKLTNNLISHFSQEAGMVQPSKSRELSVQIGYDATWLCQQLCMARGLLELIRAKQYGLALKDNQNTGLTRQQTRKHCWAVDLVRLRTTTSRLLLRLALCRIQQPEQHIAAVLKSRGTLRNHLQSLPATKRRFDIVSLFLAVRYVSYLLCTDKFGDAIQYANYCCSSEGLFGDNEEIRSAFRQQTTTMCNSALPVTRQSASRRRIHSKRRSQSVTPHRPLPIATTSMLNQRKQSVAAEPHRTRQASRLNIGLKTLGFLKRLPQKKVDPPTKLIYSRISTIKQKELVPEDLCRELQQFNDKPNFKNAQFVRQGRQLNPKETTSLLKKSKLINKRTQANETLQQNIVHCILMRNLVQMDVKFVFFGAERPCLMSMELQDTDELLLRIRTPDFQYVHSLRREDSQNNRQFVTEWPAAKYLFKRWLKKEELLKGIDRVLTINDYDIDEEGLPVALRMLQRPEIMELTELRETLRLFLNNTLYRRRNSNGWRFVLNNRTPITKVCSKNFLVRTKSLELASECSARFNDVVEMLEQYDPPLVNLHTLRHRGECILLGIYLHTSKLAGNLRNSGANSQGLPIGFIARMLASSSREVRFTDSEFAVRTDRQESAATNSIILHLIKSAVFGHHKSVAANKLASIMQHLTITENQQLQVDLTCRWQDFSANFDYTPASVACYQINVSEHPMEQLVPAHRFLLLAGSQMTPNQTQLPRRLLDYSIYDRKVTVVQQRAWHSLSESCAFKKRRVPNDWRKHLTGIRPYKLSFTATLSRKRVQLQADFLCERKGGDRQSSWHLTISAFDSNHRSRQLKLTNHDYCDLYADGANHSLCRVVEQLRSSLRVVRDSPFSRLALAGQISKNAGFITASLSTFSSQNTSQTRLLVRRQSRRSFIVSTGIRDVAGYAVVLVYRVIDELLPPWYDLEVQYSNGDTWAGRVQQDFMDGQWFRRNIADFTMVTQNSRKLAKMAGVQIELQCRLLLTFHSDGDAKWTSEIILVSSDESNPVQFQARIHRECEVETLTVKQSELIALYRLEGTQTASYRHRTTIRDLAKYFHTLIWNGNHRTAFK